MTVAYWLSLSGKVNFTLQQATKAQKGSTLSLTSALNVVGNQRHTPAALPQGNTRYSLYRRLGVPPGRSGQVREISPPPTPAGTRSPDRPARSESLYRLSYPSPQYLLQTLNIYERKREYPMCCSIFNLLKPTGHVMHHKQFNIQQLYALPALYLCVLYLSENKQRLVPLTA